MRSSIRQLAYDLADVAVAAIDRYAPPNVSETLAKGSPDDGRVPMGDAASTLNMVGEPRNDPPPAKPWHEYQQELERNREFRRQRAIEMAMGLPLDRTTDEIVSTATAFEDFIAFGTPPRANLGMATTEELAKELHSRMADPHSARPEYRTIDPR